MLRLFRTHSEFEPVDAYRHLLAPAGPTWRRLKHDCRPRRDRVARGRSGVLGGPANQAVLVTLRPSADGILAGAGTLRAVSHGPAWRIPDGAAVAPPSALELGRVPEADASVSLRYRRP